jgi:hypothetical protein
VPPWLSVPLGVPGCPPVTARVCWQATDTQGPLLRRRDDPRTTDKPPAGHWLKDAPASPPGGQPVPDPPATDPPCRGSGTTMGAVAQWVRRIASSLRHLADEFPIASDEEGG